MLFFDVEYIISKLGRKALRPYALRPYALHPYMLHPAVGIETTIDRYHDTGYKG